MRIDDIINKMIEHESFSKNEPKLTKVVSPITKDYKREDYKFQKDVFNHLLKNKNELEISEIYQLKNSKLDGALKLRSGRLVLLEIKYALNWHKCCNARIELQRFFIEKLYDKLSIKKPESALIVFHHFSGDWRKRRSKDRRYLDGWNRFYEEENIFGKRMIKADIVQLKDGRLTPFPGNIT